MSQNPVNTETNRSKNPSIWTYSFGERPHTVTAYERPDRGNAVEAKYTDEALPSRSANGERLDRRRKVPLGIDTVRNEKGKLDPQLVARAKQLVHAMHGRLANGLPARRAPLVERPLHETIFGGFDLALSPTDGKYPHTKSRRYQEMVGIRDLLFGLPSARYAAGGTDHQGVQDACVVESRISLRSTTPKPLLSTQLRWEDWTTGAARALGRQLADRYLRDGTGGIRRAEVIIDAIYSVAAWLREEGKLDSETARPADKWRRKLKSEWEEKTGTSVTVKRPRHTEEEMYRIFAALDPSYADPRTQLATDLDEHLFHAATRRQLNLDLGLYGELSVPPMGKRREPKQMGLTGDQRSTLDWAMANGVLAACEAAFRSGRISDYPLFPAGVLSNGRAVPAATMERLTQPFIDSRIRLLVEIGAECRMGQVVRCARSSLTLPELPPIDIDAALPGTLGSIVISGRGKKGGEIVIFTPEQYRSVMNALTVGYLSELEALYQAGLLKDYLMFPAGKLVQGKARVQKSPKEMHRATALEFFRELEQLAGVSSQPGRGWYGLRRKATDVARRYTTDGKVLNAQGGWKDSRTREHIYQEADDEAVKIAAATVRRASRLRLDPIATQAETMEK